MKKNYLLIILALFTTVSFSVAQCVPDPAITTPGIYPDTLVNLPPGITNTPYMTDIQLRVIPDTTALGFTVDVDNITIDNVTGLPAGFSYACSPANCVFPGGGNGCIQLTGTNATAGVYPLLVDVTLNGTIFGFIPVSVPATIVGYKVVLTDPVTPVAAFSASSTSICEDNVVTFSDMSQNSPTSWSWNFPGGNPATSNDQYPEILYSFPGTYDVELTVTNAAGSDMITMTDYITINSKPVAQVAALNPAGYCSGESVMFEANIGAGLDYQWYKYGNLLVGETGQTLTVTSGGNYKVRVTDTNVGCSRYSTPKNLTYHPIPVVSIAAQNATTFCWGESVDLLATSPLGVSVQWTKGNVAIPGATGNTYAAASSGWYKATATSAEGCTRNSTGLLVSVLQVPHAAVTASGPLSFCAGDSVVLSVGPGTGNSYQWEENLVPLAGETNVDYTAHVAGSYTVFVEAANGCFRRSGVKNVTVTCREALSSLVAQNTISLYPNPSSGLTNIELDLVESSDVVIDVYNITGKLQLAFADLKMEAGSYTLKLDLESYPRGIYFVRTMINNTVKTTKLVVQ